MLSTNWDWTSPKFWSTKCKTFNGEIVASDCTVRVIWCNFGSGISYASVFGIIPAAAYDVLIGRNLLLSREVTFFAETLKTGAILPIVGPTNKPGEGIAQQLKGRQVDAVHDKNRQKYGVVKDDSPNFSEGLFGHGKQGEMYQLKKHQGGAHHMQGQHDAPANNSLMAKREKKVIEADPLHERERGMLVMINTKVHVGKACNVIDY